jgi:hypothetical protein
MEQGRLERLAPLTGVVFFALVLAAVLVNSADTPGVGASGAKIAAYYSDHRDSTRIADFLGVVAGVFAVWFAASLRSAVWRVEGGAGRLASLILAGGVLLAGGAWTVFALDFTIAEASSKVGPGVLLPLNALNENFFFPLAGGYGVFLLAAGIGLIRTRALPVALGWVALVLGVVTFTPVGWIGVIGGSFWILIAAVFLYLRGAQPAAGAPAVVTTAPAA